MLMNILGQWNNCQLTSPQKKKNTFLMFNDFFCFMAVPHFISLHTVVGVWCLPLVLLDIFAPLQFVSLLQSIWFCVLMNFIVPMPWVGYPSLVQKRRWHYLLLHLKHPWDNDNWFLYVQVYELVLTYSPKSLAQLER